MILPTPAFAALVGLLRMLALTLPLHEPFDELSETVQRSRRTTGLVVEAVHDDRGTRAVEACIMVSVYRTRTRAAGGYARRPARPRLLHLVPPCRRT